MICQACDRLGSPDRATMVCLKPCLLPQNFRLIYFSLIPADLQVRERAGSLRVERRLPRAAPAGAGRSDAIL